MKSKLWVWFKILFNFYLRLAIRLYEIFPKKYQPSGLGIFSYLIACNILLAYRIACVFGIMSVEYEYHAFSISIIFALINCFFLIYYFYNTLDQFLINENEKGANYRKFWRITAWVYMVITTVAFFIWV
ncbi:MAG TPA: hypothetical protein DF296_10810 [Candidatus Margulisbacteria bacterium]|nr:hypothetical protein [Candidatus Margulisiibacteriota bacterium]